jgi:nucleoid-associated protein YgaU
MAAVVDYQPVPLRPRRDQADVADTQPWRDRAGAAATQPSRRSLATRQAPATRRSPAARRSTLIGLIALALAACAVWVQAGAAGSTGSGPLAAPGAGPTQAIVARVWIVQPGDTLWGIARHLQTTGDIRPLVDELSHEVHNRPLQVGQQLTLP